MRHLTRVPYIKLNGKQKDPFRVLLENNTMRVGWGAPFKKFMCSLKIYVYGSTGHQQS